MSLCKITVAARVMVPLAGRLLAHPVLIQIKDLLFCLNRYLAFFDLLNERLCDCSAAGAGKKEDD